MCSRVDDQLLGLTAIVAANDFILEGLANFDKDLVTICYLQSILGLLQGLHPIVRNYLAVLGPGAPRAQKMFL